MGGCLRPGRNAPVSLGFRFLCSDKPSSRRVFVAPPLPSQRPTAVGADTSAGNSLLSTVCSDPQALLSPQWKWNWHSLNRSWRGPPFSAAAITRREKNGYNTTFTPSLITNGTYMLLPPPSFFLPPLNVYSNWIRWRVRRTVPNITGPPGSHDVSADQLTFLQL